MNRSENVTEISKALAAVQSEMQPAINNSKNPFFNSDYADFEAVKAAAQPYLAKNGLAVIHVPWVTDGKMYLECVVLHSSGQWISGMYPVNPVKNDPQSIGSAVTYAKRYSFSAMVGVVTKDDDDGNAATKPGEKPRAGDKRDDSRVPAPKPQRPPTPPGPPKNNPAMERALPVGPTEKQLTRLFTIAGQKGWNTEGVHVWLKDNFGLDSAKKLNRTQYDQACDFFINAPPDDVPY